MEIKQWRNSKTEQEEGGLQKRQSCEDNNGINNRNNYHHIYWARNHAVCFLWTDSFKPTNIPGVHYYYDYSPLTAEEPCKSIINCLP